MPREPFHRLFFAVRPPPDLVPEIAALRDSFGQMGDIVGDDRLHLTTWLFPDTQDFAAEAATRAQAAMEEVPRERFRIVLDETVAGPRHVILRPSETLHGFAAFQARLDRALRQAGLAPRAGWHFSPHLTLLYGSHDAPGWFPPIGWTAEEIVLIDSMVGRSRHRMVARWPLG